MTNTESQAYLAEQLRERITYAKWIPFGGDGTFAEHSYRWKPKLGGMLGDSVKETEWLHIAHEVEGKMTDEQKEIYEEC